MNDMVRIKLRPEAENAKRRRSTNLPCSLSPVILRDTSINSQKQAEPRFK